MSQTAVEKEGASPAPETPKKKASPLKIILGIVGGVFALGLAGVIAFVVAIIVAISSYVNMVYTSESGGVPTAFGMGMVSIQTESMTPTLEPGDLVFLSPVNDPSTLKVGDVITYWTVINGDRVLNTHRIENIYDGGDYLLFETKGDANTAVDAITTHESEVVGVYAFKIPGLGELFDRMI